MKGLGTFKADRVLCIYEAAERGISAPKSVGSGIPCHRAEHTARYKRPAVRFGRAAHGAGDHQRFKWLSAPARTGRAAGQSAKPLWTALPNRRVKYFLFGTSRPRAA